MPSSIVREESSHPAARNLLTRNETLRYHKIKTRSRSPSHLGLVRYRVVTVVTDRQNYDR